MCEACDVLQSSYQPANVMTSTFCDYGNGSMGCGIRKLAEEMQTNGYKNGFADGLSLGFVKGSIIATATCATVALTSWGIAKIAKNRKKKQAAKTIVSEKDIPYEEEDCSNVEV